MRGLLFAAGVLAAAGAWAGDGSRVGGPVLGLVWDGPAGGVRVIHGIPVSAVVSEAMPVGENAGAAAKDYAVVAEAEGASVWRLRGTGLERTPIKGAAAGISRVAISPAGSAAALWLPERRAALIVKGLPAAPGVAAEYSLRGYSEPEQLAVSDDGTVAAAVRDGETTLLVRAGPEEVREAGRLRAVSGLAFVRGSRDLLAADPAGNEVWLFRLAGFEQPERVAAEADGVQTPAALNASDHGDRIFVANRGGTVLIIERRDGKIRSVQSPVEVTCLDRLDRDSVFRIHELSEGPLWLLDAREAEPKLRFATPSRISDAGGESQ